MARYNISVLARHDNGMFDYIGHLMSLDVEELHNINNTVTLASFYRNMLPTII